MMTNDLSVGGYMLVQTATLVLHYGFNIKLIWWVLWFPSLIILPIVIFIAIITAIIGLAVKSK